MAKRHDGPNTFLFDMMLAARVMARHPIIKHPVDRLVGGNLLGRVNEKTGSAYPAVRTVADEIGYKSRNTIHESIARLTDSTGLALFERETYGGVGHSNANRPRWGRFAELATELAQLDKQRRSAKKTAAEKAAVSGKLDGRRASSKRLNLFAHFWLKITGRNCSVERTVEAVRELSSGEDSQLSSPPDTKDHKLKDFRFLESQIQKGDGKPGDRPARKASSTRPRLRAIDGSRRASHDQVSRNKATERVERDLRRILGAAYSSALEGTTLELFEAAIEIELGRPDRGRGAWHLVDELGLEPQRHGRQQ